MTTLHLTEVQLSIIHHISDRLAMKMFLFISYAFATFRYHIRVFLSWVPTGIFGKFLLAKLSIFGEFLR